mmetsp:Transcript_11120/g.22146  ORF Transcript_11120/g.22146 Transcript_11120/m.22146 type:complete len:499 (+) Transcript_11120:1135-2631(+)
MRYSRALHSVAGYAHLLPSPCSSFIRGRFLEPAASNASSFVVRNPFHGGEVATVIAPTAAQVDDAVDAAMEAFSIWSDPNQDESRVLFLRNWASLLKRNREFLAQIITLENGKTLSHALSEVDYATSFLDYYANLSLDADEFSRHGASIIRVQKRPVGVVAAITPWNFPAAMVTRKLSAGLRVGCTFVVKPSAATPLTALALCKLAVDADIPPGVMNVLPIHPDDTRQMVHRILSSKKLAKVTFTGSTAVGKEIILVAKQNLLRVSLELGGVAPCLICHDADLDRAVSGIISNKIRGSGQTCIAINYILAHQSICDQLGFKLTHRLSTVKVGDGFDSSVDMGPLINAQAVKKCQRHVADAVNRGARILLGAQQLQGNVFMPTILVNVEKSSVVCHEETFGPVLPIVPFIEEAEAVSMMNGGDAGLVAYLYSNDHTRAASIAEKLKLGMVGVNTTMISDASQPFGGVKQSGCGREGSRYGLDSYLELKYVRSASWRPPE